MTKLRYYSVIQIWYGLFIACALLCCALLCLCVVKSQYKKFHIALSFAIDPFIISHVIENICPRTAFKCNNQRIIN